MLPSSSSISVPLGAGKARPAHDRGGLLLDHGLEPGPSDVPQPVETWIRRGSLGFACGWRSVFASAPQNAASGFSIVEHRKRDTVTLVLPFGGWSYSGNSESCLVACL